MITKDTLFCLMQNDEVYSYRVTQKETGLGINSPIETYNAKGFYLRVDIKQPIGENQKDGGHTHSIDHELKVVTFVHEVVDIPLDELAKAKNELVTRTVQNILDTEARSLRWDNIKSARAGAGVPLDGTETAEELSIHDEALSLARWDRAVWAYLNKLEADLSATPPSRTEPTLDELIAELPQRV